MIVTPLEFDTFDRCQRRLALERTHVSKFISPLGLLYAGVESAITSPDPGQSAKDAILELSQRVDVQSGDLSAVSIIRHVGMLAEVISLALRRKIGRLTRLDPVKLGKHEWKSNLFETKSGAIHRIILASHMDDDSLRSFAHSWGTIGELAALERPVYLTVVVIGSQRAGRRHSFWTKCYQHPVQKHCLRFARRKGGKADGFTEGWRDVWREQTQISADTWLDQMESDDVFGELIVTRKVAYNATDERMITAKKDMFKIIPQMESASVDSPMRRSSCDEIGRGACPWQNYCYSPVPVTLEELQYLYRPR